MNPAESSIAPGDGKYGRTACGVSILVTSETPYIYYHDEMVYFCGQDCKQLYDEDPLNSCMAARLLTGK